MQVSNAAISSHLLLSFTDSALNRMINDDPQMKQTHPLWCWCVRCDGRASGLTNCGWLTDGRISIHSVMNGEIINFIIFGNLLSIFLQKIVIKCLEITFHVVRWAGVYLVNRTASECVCWEQHSNGCMLADCFPLLLMDTLTEVMSVIGSLHLPYTSGNWSGWRGRGTDPHSIYTQLNCNADNLTLIFNSH